MSSCAYTIHGISKSFKDKEEAVKWIKENPEKIITKIKDTTLYSTAQQTETTARIKKIQDTLDKIEVQEIKDFNYQKSHKYVLKTIGKSIVGTTALSKALMEFKEIGKVFNLKKFAESSKANKAKEEATRLGRELNPTELDAISKQVDKQIATFEKTAEIGTALHKINELIFKSPLDIDEDLRFEDYKDFFFNENYFKLYVEKIISKKESIIEEVRNKYGDETPIFLTETLITSQIKNIDEINKHLPDHLKLNVDNLKNLAGTVDLIVILPDGSIDIYDFKTSNKSYEQWDANKNIAIEFQLEFYRKMLEKQGVNVNNLKIIPILFDTVEESGEYKILSVEIQQDEKITIQGKISNIIDNIIPEQESKVRTSNPVVKNIVRFLKEMLNYEKQTIKSPSVEKVRNFLNYEDKDPKRNSSVLIKKIDGDNVSIIFYNKIDNVLMKWEDYKKKIGIQNDEEAAVFYLKAVAIDNANIAINVADYFEKMRTWILSKKETTEPSYKNDYANIKKNAIDMLFKKYYEDLNWKMLPRDEEMEDLNIIGFYNIKTFEVDYIAVTNEYLDGKLKTTYDGNIAGNFERNYVNPDLMDNTVGSALLIKTALFAQNSGRLDKKFKSARIQVLSLNNNSKPIVQTTKEVNRNIKYLFTKKNDFNLILSEDYMINKLNALLEHYISLMTKTSSLSYKYKSLYKELIETENKEEILDFLFKRQQALTKQYTKNPEDLKHDFEFQLVNEAILQLENIDIPVEEDIYKFGYYLVSNAGSKGKSASEIDAPNNMTSEILKIVKAYVDKALYNIRFKFFEFHKTVNPLITKLLDSKQSKISRYTFGNMGIAYENLIEKDENGNPTMRIKPLNQLQGIEREFAQMFMDIIAQIRESNLSNFDIELTDDQRREIPLVMASTFTKIKNSSKDLKTIQQVIEREFDDLINVDRLFSEENEQRLKDRSKYTSQFKWQEAGNNRENLLNSRPISDFETDLELVLYYYVMSHIKEKEFNKVLPVLNALKGLSFIAESNIFQNLTNVYDYIKSYIDANVFNQIERSSTEQTVQKLMSIPASITSTLAIGLSPTTGLVQLIIGLAANYSATISSLLGFDQKQFVLGYTKVIGDIRIDSINKTEELNNMYGVISRDVDLLVQNMSNTNTGLRAFMSRGMHWMNYAPDYVNRMAILTAKMIHDGSYEAHSIIDGKIYYNEKLDKRWQTNGVYNPNHPKLVFLKSIMKEEDGLNDDGTLKRAYSWKEMRNLKELGNRLHGNYSKEDKIKLARSVWGALYMQFKTWMRAGIDRYWLTYRTSDAVGEYVPVYETDEEGNIIKNEKGEPVIKLNEDGIPMYHWQGSFNEGMLNTVIYLFRELHDNKNWNVIEGYQNLPEWRKRNLKHLASDSLIISLLGLLAAFIDDDDDEESKKKVNDKIAYLLYKSAKDLFILNTIGDIANTKMPIASISYTADMIKDAWNIPDKGVKPFITNIGLGRLYYTIIE